MVSLYLHLSECKGITASISRIWSKSFDYEERRKAYLALMFTNPGKGIIRPLTPPENDKRRK
jgi:hypothetical protein